MTRKAEGAARRIRVVAALLIVGLAAGPAASHLYWMLGGTWGLHTSGASVEESTTGIRIVAAMVVLLLVAAVSVVLARVGLWQQTFVSDRLIQVFAWALAAFFLGHALVSFARSQYEWWLYGPVGLVIGLLALVVAGLGGAGRASTGRTARCRRTDLSSEVGNGSIPEERETDRNEEHPRAAIEAPPRGETWVLKPLNSSVAREPGSQS